MPYSTKSCTDCRRQRVSHAADWFDFQTLRTLIGLAVVLLSNSTQAQSPPSDLPTKSGSQVADSTRAGNTAASHTGIVETRSLASRLSQYETDAAVALGNLKAIARIEKASKLRPLYDSMIETETVRLALRRSLRRAGQVTESTAQFASMQDSKRRVQMTAYSDRNRRHDDGVVTLLKRKRLRLPPSDEQEPTANNVAIAKEFEPIRITPPPARALKSPSEPPSMQIGLAKDVANTGQPTVERKNNSDNGNNSKSGNTNNTAATSSKHDVRSDTSADAKVEKSLVAELEVQRNPYTDPVVVVSVPGQPDANTDQDASLLIEEAKQFPVAEATVATAAKKSPEPSAQRTTKAVAVDRTTNQDVVESKIETIDAAASPAQTTTALSSPASSSTTSSSTVSSSTVPAPANIAEMAAEQPDAKVAMQWPFQLGGPKKITAPEGARDVTLSVNDVDVRVVFEMLSKGYGMNILVAPDVDGTVTANVAGLSPQQTLRSVVRMCGLAAQEEDGVILVYPRDNQPLESRVLRRFPLDYARSEILEPAVQGLLSPIGNAYSSKADLIDHRKGQEAIVVIDTLDVVQQVERYIMEADQPPRQVMIEARVLEVELKDDMEHGVNLESFFGGDFRSGAFQLTENIATSTNPFFFSEINGSDLYAGITMLETTTDAKTLATPRVMVVNGQNAKIQVGQQLGFAVLTVTQTSTVQDVRYLDTGVVLDVTPTISREGKILMQVAPKVSSGEINPDTLLPEETTREVQTSVLLSNHHGMIIGGLIQEEDRVTIRKLPWLGDVKHVGRFFQQRSTNRGRSEIIVALIPHIVENGIEENCGCADPMRDQDEWERTSTPLFDGPLNRTCRPWEARLPDETSNGVLFKDHLRQKNVKPYSKGCEPIKTNLRQGKLGLR